jgi:hypothetical protein
MQQDNLSVGLVQSDQLSHYQEAITAQLAHQEHSMQTQDKQHVQHVRQENLETCQHSLNVHHVQLVQHNHYHNKQYVINVHQVYINLVQDNKHVYHVHVVLLLRCLVPLNAIRVWLVPPKTRLVRLFVIHV